VAVVAINTFGLPEQARQYGPGITLIAVHISFNICVLSLVVLAPLLDRSLKSLLPDPPPDTTLKPLYKSHLDPTVKDVPVRALASLRREVIRMADVLAEMLSPAMGLYQTYDIVQAKRIAAEDAVLNKALDDIRHYASDLPVHAMEKSEKKEMRALIDYAIAIEAAGDLLVKRLLPLAKEKSDNRLRFSPDGWIELSDLHKRLVRNLGTASSVLVSDDLVGARQLIGEKAEMARLERRTRKAHLKRLTAGVEESFGSSDVHIETAYTLKEMHSWVVTVAHPILVREGQLLETRLADELNADLSR
jgi:phosphate:Na+ symporter